MSLSKKLAYKGTLRQVFICLRPPPLLGFSLGRQINFVGSESGQMVIYIAFNSSRMWSSTQLNTPPPPPPRRTLFVYTVL
jgi:hypothetical protein